MKIAVIAHDGKKAEMVPFLRSHLDILRNKNIHLIATGTTGKHAMDAGLIVEKQSGFVGTRVVHVHPFFKSCRRGRWFGCSGTINE